MEILGELLVGLVELFALSEIPKGFIWLLFVLAVIGGIIYYFY